MKKKIVTIWSTYGPYHIARVNALNELGYELICFSYCSSQNDYPFFALTPTHHELINNCELSTVNPLKSFLQTLRLLQKHKPDLILSCGYERPETLASLVYAKLNNIKVFVFAVNQIDDKERNQWVERIKSIYLSFFDGFCVGGFTHLNYLSVLGVLKQKVCFGYNCVDNFNIDTLSTHFRTTKECVVPFENYFLCVSRLVKKKNIPTLIQAYEVYKQSLNHGIQPWNLLIGGDGDLGDDIYNQVNASNLLKEVILLGRVDDFKLLVCYYAFAKALILPSNQSEQWGLVVNEAMAAKIPILVARQCGCSQHLVEEGINGFSFDGNSVKELADCMIWMHQNQHLLTSMGERSWEIVQRFSPQKFAHNIKTLYESLN